METENLVWLRNDLRLEDNPAIYRASKNNPIRIVFILTLKQWQHHNVSEARIGLMLDIVKNISMQCNELGITFDVLKCNWFSDIPEQLNNYCHAHTINELWFNRETPFDEEQRDLKVANLLHKFNIQVNALAHDLIVSQPVFNLSKKPFKVFTAYYKKWLLMLKNQNNNVLRLPNKQAQNVNNDISLLEKHQFAYRHDLWSPCIDKINSNFVTFCHKKLFTYENLRDFPNTVGTSLLSPYLSLGCLGPRTCLHQINSTYKQTNGEDQKNWINSSWLRELAWRDLYRQLMVHYPYISKNQDFKAKTKTIPWREDEIGFEKWCLGQTGFPIIDAAMRQLNQTGWMHNRLRMLAASFLTKLLFVDWRKGEKYFMQTLIDGEFSANNGGWQWSASTGCDSAPYFRVFNPTLQSEKFDKTGGFIRKFVPEIAELDNKSIHNPTSIQRQKLNYAETVIDYKTARLKAIEIFKYNNSQ